jgi:type I restriction enzyme, S subunit
MELKPGYEQTEVGVLPDDWPVVLLDSVAKRGSGHTPDKAHPGYWNGNIKWVSLQDSPRLDRLYISDTAAKITPDGIANSSAKMHPAGTVVLSRDAGVGKSSIMATDMAVSQHFIAWTCGPSLDNHFLYYLLQAGKSEFERIAMGSTIKTIGLPFFRQFKVPLPARAEQKAIAQSLSDADALVESLEQLLVKKRQVKQGAMHELLTGKKRLPGFTTSWENTHFGSLGTIYGGLAGKTKQHFESGNARYITFMNVMANTIIDSEILQFVDVRPHESQNEVMRGDILFNGSSETPEELGMAAYVSTAFDRVYLNSFCFGFRQDHPEAADGLFLAYYFRSQVGRELLKSLAQGAIRYNLSKTALLKLRFPLPSKPEQVSIAASLSDMDAEIAAVKSRITKARQIKQGMMQELVTGRIRLARRSAQILSFPVKENASVAKVSHNAQINEAVVIAVLAAKFGSDKFPLGRFRRTKFSYLLHRHVEHEAAGFMKKAAGPYNPRTRYGGAEKIALQNRYVRLLHTENGEGFVADEKIAQAEDYFDKWYGAEALTWLEQFRYQKNDALELLTTVDMACEDLSRAGKAVTLSAVKQVIHDSPEWKAKLNRSVFSDDNIETTIKSCGQLFPFEEE